MSQATQLSKHPKSLWILASVELCERFAFWGVGFLLVLYLIEFYQFSHVKATQIYGIFTGAAAFLPLIGGYLADRWNYQAPLFIGALVNALGCFMISTGSPTLLYPALAITALGYGIFTPSILTVLAYTYRDKPTLREAGFSIYYASINVGVFLALLSLGSISKWIGWNSAFFTAGCVQLLGLIPLIWYMLKHKETYRGLYTLQKQGRSEKTPLTPTEKDRIRVLSIFCFFTIVFWIAYNQAFSSMAIFAHDYMDRTFWGIEIPEGIFMSSESLFLILLAPLLALLYARLQKINKDPSAAMKTTLSLFSIALCFFIMMIACKHIPADATKASVSSGYLVTAYFLMALGEMLLAPIGLSMFAHLAPHRYTAFFIGLWYLCVGVAFYIGGMMAGWMESVGGLYNFFSIFVALTFIPALILLALYRKLTKMSHIRSDTSVELGPR